MTRGEQENGFHLSTIRPIMPCTAASMRPVQLRIKLSASLQPSMQSRSDVSSFVKTNSIIRYMVFTYSGFARNPSVPRLWKKEIFKVRSWTFWFETQRISDFRQHRDSSDKGEISKAITQSHISNVDQTSHFWNDFNSVYPCFHPRFHANESLCTPYVVVERHVDICQVINRPIEEWLHNDSKGNVMQLFKHHAKALQRRGCSDSIHLAKQKNGCR